jgi:hypothetical protein
MALEYYFYQEPVGADDLKEIILRAVISDLDSDDMEDAVKGLLKAYWAIVGLDEDAPEVKALDGKEAEDFYRKVYVKAFSARIPGYLDEDDPEVSWAEALPIYESGVGYEMAKLFPVEIVKVCALAAAERDVANLKAFAAYNKAVETPGTPEHEDLKHRFGEDRAAEMVAHGKARNEASAEVGQ